MEFVEFELRNYRSYCQPSSVVIELFADIVVKCELKPDEDVKAFTSITITKMYIQQLWPFSKARDIVQKL